MRGLGLACAAEADLGWRRPAHPWIAGSSPAMTFNDFGIRRATLHQPVTTAPSRDPYLDCLKGFAIVTVVLGHTFQNATADFDHYLTFRLV